MSRGGQNAKTRGELRLTGGLRPSRHAALASPAPVPGRPVPPKRLTGETLAEWTRLCARLEAQGALHQCDDAVIYQAARQHAETEELVDLFAASAQTIATLQAQLSEVPAADRRACLIQIAKLRQAQLSATTKIRQGRLAVRLFLSELGLTPASRGRVRLVAKPKDNDFDEFDAFGKVQ